MASLEIDVLIVGAGPTGLMLAAELSLQKVSYRIIDRAASRSTKSRALVVHPRSLELLNRHGIAQELYARGPKLAGLRIFSEKATEHFAGLPYGNFGAGDTEFPSTVFVSQCETEALLEEAVAKHGKRVERPVEATHMIADSDGVWITLTHGDGHEERVSYKYVVGCDGTHSTVRTSAGIPFHGDNESQGFLLGDVFLDGWKDAGINLNMFLAKGVLVVAPLSDGRYRVTASRKAGLDAPKNPSLDELQEAWLRYGPDGVTLRDPTWLTSFKVRHRGATNYRKGRIFVCGDAAHNHSPAGGQGMNTGIQDAANLGWKLGSVLRGENPDSFLDSYHDERSPIGKMLLKRTDRFFRFAARGHWLFVRIRNFLAPHILPLLFAKESCGQKVYSFISQLTIRYRKSKIVGTSKSYRGHLRGGDRCPDGRLIINGDECMLMALCQSSQHHLIFFSGSQSTIEACRETNDAAMDFSKHCPPWMKIHCITYGEASVQGNIDVDGVLHKRYGFVDSGYALVRPDGYLAHIGSLNALDELRVWLKLDEKIY